MFYKMCKQLPITIEKLIEENNGLQVEKDIVLEELRKINKDTLTSLYMLAFSTYEGFNRI